MSRSGLLALSGPRTRLVRWDVVLASISIPAGAGPHYYEFCARFRRLYEACREAGVSSTVKSLDQYLGTVSA